MTFGERDRGTFCLLSVIMEAMREAWTDGRLDDLSQRMDRGFDRVDADMRALNVRIEGLQEAFGSLQRTMLQVGAGLFAAIVGVMVTLATQI
jgi:hypothetical protein